MFERQFGLRENPFSAGHQSRFVYPSREHQEALAHLRFGIENREPFVLITGEVGTGKTTALYDVLAEWEARAVVALITNSSLTRDELLEEICLRFGLPVTGALTKPQALVQLERFLQSVRGRGHRAILLLDEAQNLDRELLEEIRLLSNLESQGEKMLQVFLVGQPELEDKLARAELRQLRQRITVHYRLNPLSEEDTEHYIHHRISVAGGHALSLFPHDACSEVYRVTLGIPREINTVAAQAMLNAFVEDSPMVLPEHVRAVERDSEFKSVLRAHPDASAQAAALPATAAPSAPPVTTAPAPLESAPPPVAVAPPAPAPAEPDVVTRHEPQAVTRPGPPPFSAPPEPARMPSAAIEAGIEPEETGPPQLREHMPTNPVRPAGSPLAWENWLASLAETEAAESREDAPAPAKEMDAPTSSPEPSAHVEPAGWREMPPPAEAAPIPDVRSLVEPLRVREVETSAPPRLVEPSRASEAEPAPPSFVEPFGALDAEPPAPPSFVEPFGALDARPHRPSSFVEPLGAIETPAETIAERPIQKALDEDPFINPKFEPASRAAESPMSSASATLDVPMTVPNSLPPRLRRKLEFEETGRSGNKTGPWMIGVAAVVVVIIGALVVVRIGASRREHAAASGVTKPVSAPASPQPTAIPIEEPPTSPAVKQMAAASRPTARQAGTPADVASPSTPSVNRGTSPAPPRQSPTVAPAGAGANTAHAASGTGIAPTVGKSDPQTAFRPETPAMIKRATPAKPAELFGVAVGTYLNEDRAAQEREKLAASTNLPARVQTVTEDNVAMFRIVMGAFEDRLAAERAASSLIEKGLVDEARVIAFAKPVAPKP